MAPISDPPEAHGTVADLEQDEWDRCMAVNPAGNMLAARACVDSPIAMRGSFTAIASDAATQCSQGFAAYTASKHGVIGLVRSMAMDFGYDGVRSKAVCPGFIETPVADRIFADVGEGDSDYYRNTIPLGRFALPGEIAFAVRHFIESTYANGVVYALSGGSTAGYFVPPQQ